MRIFINFIIIIFICLSAFAQNINNVPVTIQADNVKYFDTEKQTEFIGNVVAVSSQYTLTADHVNVYSSGKNRIAYVKCSGNVNFKTEDIMAVAEKANLDQEKKILELEGNVQIWRNDNYFEGDKIIINYETKEMTADKGKNDKITVIFNPEDGK